ncbi:MAG: MarC family protein [Desulfurococcales archaeon]|nr:MarC family protein [Desulfurococcales archaeon]
MEELVDLYLRILAILNPFTAASVYLSLTGKSDYREASRIVLQSLGLVVFLGILVIAAGYKILELMGVSLPSLSMGGGILLLVISIDMITGQHRVRNVEEGEIAVVPLATPMILGPGAITLLLHLSASNPKIYVTIAFIAAALTVGAVLYISPLLRRVLGVTGVKALSKFIALLISAIASEMIHAALVEWGVV